jgi:hypothetical protein
MVEQSHVLHCPKLASYVPEFPALMQPDGENLHEKVAVAAHCQPALGLDSARVSVLWEEEHSPCGDELHCMTESVDGHLRTEADYGQETVHKATMHYVEGDGGCLGLGCYMDKRCWGLDEDAQVTSETEITISINVIMHQHAILQKVQAFHAP